MIKQVLRPDRLRRPPARGFSWVDRRFMHEFAPVLNRDAVYLYLFLTAVSDKSGLSYYKDQTIHDRTGITTKVIAQARDELLHRDLIAYAPPLYQVLSLPSRKGSFPSPVPFGEIMASLAQHRKKGGMS